ncbi:MAG: glycosyltransferase family 4 protein [Acidiferrobacterales bacterium]
MSVVNGSAYTAVTTSRARDRRIRVLIVDQATAFGGSIVVASRLVRALDPSKFEFQVVSEMDIAILRTQFGDCRKVEIVRHPFTYTDHARMMRWLDRMPMSALIAHPVMYAMSLVSTSANAVYAWRLGLRILRGKVDVVHLNNGMDNSEAAFVTWLLRRRMLVHAHGPSQFGFLRRFLARRTHGFVAVSTHIKEDLVGKGVPDKLVEIIPNPAEKMTINHDLIQSVRARYGLKPGQRVFGIFGRIVSWKGHREFVRAASEVLRSMPEAVAVVVGDVSDGDRELWDELHDLVRKQGLEDRFIFTGYIAKVVELYGIMDVVVHASTRPEPFGLVITEAMACGVPVVASNLGAPSEIIDDGKDGLIVDPTDTPALAQAIRSLLMDERLRSEMGDLGRRKVLAKYNMDDYARRMEEAYRRALGDDWMHSARP